MNKGALQLGTHCTAHGDQARMARQLRIGPDLLSRILSGKVVPQPKLRAAIEDEYPDVGWRLFDESAEEAPSEVA